MKIHLAVEFFLATWILIIIIGPVEFESTHYDWKSFSLPLTYEPCLPFFLNLETTSLINFDPPGIDNYQPLGNLLQRYLKFTMKQVEFFDNDKFE